MMQDNETYVRMYGLVVNRIGIINQLHGYCYHHGSGAPCVMRRSHGLNVVIYYGCDVACWRDGDCSALDDAYRVVDGLCNAVWLVRRAGKLLV